MSYTDQELEALLVDLESIVVERKASWRGDVPTKARQAICAFANDLPDTRRPGVLFVGATDEGQPSGLPITDELLRTLADLRTDGQILPTPALQVEKRHLLGHAMAVVTVLPADAPPVRYDGRIWIRPGPRRALASAQDERILNEKRRFRDCPFELQPLPSAPLSAINRLYFEQEYLPHAFAPDVLEANERSYEQRLAACRMIIAADQPTPTILGMLVMGQDPRFWLPSAYLQFLRIAGTTLADPIMDEAAIDGPLATVMRRVDDKLEAHNRTRVDLATDSQERRVSLYSRVALQQLVRNAIMHRTYEHTNTPVRVTWFDDRLEILSPGGPFGQVNESNFGQPGMTDYRNPSLAEAMKVLGFVQRFGVGIQTAQAALAKNGNPPLVFKVSSSFVLATVWPSP